MMAAWHRLDEIMNQVRGSIEVMVADNPPQLRYIIYSRSRHNTSLQSAIAYEQFDTMRRILGGRYNTMQRFAADLRDKSRAWNWYKDDV